MKYYDITKVASCVLFNVGRTHVVLESQPAKVGACIKNLLPYELKCTNIQVNFVNLHNKRGFVYSLFKTDKDDLIIETIDGEDHIIFSLVTEYELDNEIFKKIQSDLVLVSQTCYVTKTNVRDGVECKVPLSAVGVPYKAPADALGVVCSTSGKNNDHIILTLPRPNQDCVDSLKKDGLVHESDGAARNFHKDSSVKLVTTRGLKDVVVRNLITPKKMSHLVSIAGPFLREYSYAVMLVPQLTIGRPKSIMNSFIDLLTQLENEINKLHESLAVNS